MKWLPSSFGADPRKLLILGGLLVVLGGVVWFNLSPSEPETSVVATKAPPSATTPAVPSRPGPVPSPTAPVRNRANAVPMADFRPSLKLPEGLDVSQIDPALKLGLLAKLREVSANGGTRSLFDFSEAPAPPPAVKPIIPAAKPVEAPKTEAKTETPEAPKTPPPPPITLKFFGYSGNARAGARRAFFLDGDEIFVAGENDLVRNRYKIVRIGVNSAVVEDTTNKNQQTLPLVEELGG